MAYEYKNKKGQKYYLHTRTVKLRGSGRVQTIYFFSRKVGKGAMEELPNGYKVRENPRNYLPILKKK